MLELELDLVGDGRLRYRLDEALAREASEAAGDVCPYGEGNRLLPKGPPQDGGLLKRTFLSRFERVDPGRR